MTVAPAPAADSPMLIAALAHAAAGRPVFPCGNDKRPIIPKRSGGNGFKDATRNAKTIRDWWTKYPRALIGMPTGKVTHTLVLDVDNDKAKGLDGSAALAVVEKENGRLPSTVESMTPRGGRHLIFQHPGSKFDVPNSVSKVGPGLDIRGDGGYIILPPSQLPDGRCYQWEGSSDPDEGVRAAPAPAWLLAIVATKQTAEAWPVKPLVIPNRIPDGQRGDTLYRLACSLRARGLGEAAILAALRVENAERCDPPVTEERLLSTAKSAATKPAGLSPEAEQRRRPRLAVAPAVAQATGGAPPPKPRPLIVIRAGELDRVCDEAQAALEGADSGIYRQGSRLTRIGRAADLDEDAGRGTREPDAPALYALTTPAMVDALAHFTSWQKWDARSKAIVSIDPPRGVADIILAREAQWRFPRLIGYTECPCVTPDGRLIAAPGYDAPTGLIVLPHPLNPSKIPRSALREDAREAIKVLREWLSTFTFATRADESAALAAALTAVHRRPLPTAPVIVVTGSTPGIGKSRLAEGFGVLATGRKPAFFTAGHTPEELEKRLDAMLLTGDQVAVLDNLDRPLKSDVLCTAATQEIKSIRVLGLSRNVDCPTKTAIIMTGNNMVLRGDIQRRVLMIRLDAGVERPEERVFTRDPSAYTRECRVALLHAALTLPLGYFAAGCPDVGVTPYGSFEAWDRMIRRPLIWAGMPDPLAAAVSMRDEDTELGAMRDLYTAWRALWGDAPVMPSTIIEHARTADQPQTAFGFTAPAPRPTALASRTADQPQTAFGFGAGIEHADKPNSSADLAEALRNLLGEGPSKFNAQLLGFRLRAWQGRILDGYQITRAPRSASGVRYVLAQVCSV